MGTTGTAIGITPYTRAIRELRSGSNSEVSADIDALLLFHQTHLIGGSGADAVDRVVTLDATAILELVFRKTTICLYQPNRYDTTKPTTNTAKKRPGTSARFPVKSCISLFFVIATTPSQTTTMRTIPRKIGDNGGVPVTSIPLSIASHAMPNATLPLQLRSICPLICCLYKKLLWPRFPINEDIRSPEVDFHSSESRTSGNYRSSPHSPIIKS